MNEGNVWTQWGSSLLHQTARPPDVCLSSDTSMSGWTHQIFGLHPLISILELTPYLWGSCLRWTVYALTMITIHHRDKANVSLNPRSFLKLLHFSTSSTTILLYSKFKQTLLIDLYEQDWWDTFIRLPTVLTERIKYNRFWPKELTDK